MTINESSSLTGWCRSHWRSVAQGLGIGIGLLVAGGIISATAETALSGAEKEIWAAAISEVIMGFGVLFLLWRLGWLRLAAVTTRWRPRGIPGSAWIIVACLLPAVGLASTTWEPTERIVALAADYLATGFYEELAFRGLIFVFLARAWQNYQWGIVTAATVSGIIFGVVHFNPFLLILGPLFALAFCRLQIDARTIWISVVLHASFDWFTEFPFNADGTSGEHWSQAVALGALVVAGILGFRALRAHHHNLNAAMAVALK